MNTYFTSTEKKHGEPAAGGVAQVPIYLKISSETGDWAGDIKNAKLPDEMKADYVRAYQLIKKDGTPAFTPKPLKSETSP